MTINNKSKRNYQGKCLGWPVTSYSAVDVANKLIKITAEPLSKPPAHLYNHSITTGVGLLVLFSTYGGNHFKSEWLPFTLVTTYIFFLLFHSHIQNIFLFSYLFNYTTDVN